MLQKMSRKLALGALFLTILALGAFAFVEYQKARYYGGLTRAVDRAAFIGEGGPILIENVAILSEDGATMLPSRFVLIRDGKIARIGAAREGLGVPDGAKVLDGRGKYLIPGLIDSHVHLERRSNDLLVLLAHGVTYVREMGGSRASLEMRQATRAGAAGPHMYVASRKIYGDAGFHGIFTAWTRTRINIADPADADSVALRLAEQGYDAIKIGGFTTPEVHRAVLAAAKERNLDPIGHLHKDSTLKDMLSSGQRELSHVEEVTKALINEYGGYGPDEGDRFLAYVRRRADDVARDIREARIAVGSSIALMDSIPVQKFALAPALCDLDLRYVDPGQIEGTLLTPGWLSGENIYGLAPDEAADPARSAAVKRWWTTYVEAVRVLAAALSRNGATILAGTDVGTPILVPGKSLHQELQALVASGLSARQALHSATAAPGEWLGKPVGRIVPGYAADLVLLDADPLVDISHTSRVSDVFVVGRLFRRGDLDRMLAEVAQANQAARTVDVAAHCAPRAEPES
ncbi:MAG: amidohydrolase family protein [Sphingopyxis sp.]|uniref:amidohydrolase family protein n=1 Tax=Sphingopyxis sp. TaxID=1908224 RepID=UPI002ABA5819|nr:amidohydrolase family protein [Sphingopyxis sp.]MDZ3832791.1 amidohydrolase family protein [Sphingopyxis sp.]